VSVARNDDAFCIKDEDGDELNIQPAIADGFVAILSIQSGSVGLDRADTIELIAGLVVMLHQYEGS